MDGDVARVVEAVKELGQRDRKILRQQDHGGALNPESHAGLDLNDAPTVVGLLDSAVSDDPDRLLHATANR